MALFRNTKTTLKHERVGLVSLVVDGQHCYGTTLLGTGVEKFLQTKTGSPEETIPSFLSNIRQNDAIRLVWVSRQTQYTTVDFTGSLKSERKFIAAAVDNFKTQELLNVTAPLTPPYAFAALTDVAADSRGLLKPVLTSRVPVEQLNSLLALVPPSHRKNISVVPLPAAFLGSKETYVLWVGYSGVFFATATTTGLAAGTYLPVDSVEVILDRLGIKDVSRFHDALEGKTSADPIGVAAAKTFVKSLLENIESYVNLWNAKGLSSPPVILPAGPFSTNFLLAEGLKTLGLTVGPVFSSKIPVPESYKNQYSTAVAAGASLPKSVFYSTGNKVLAGEHG